MNIFIAGFWILIVICLALFVYSRSSLPTSNDASFRSFQRSYLVVYLLAMTGDWLQGPYVYALYDDYGMSTHDIEILFVVGFGSSMIFGTVVGSIADKYGRKTNCVLYGILYGLACVTKHFNNFSILMIGRLLGGIATSILYSAFESWVIHEHHKHFNNITVLVIGRLLSGIASSILHTAFESWLIHEHNKRGFDSSLLGTIFSHAIVGNSIVAIVSGVVAQQAADFFGYVAPFDASLGFLTIMCVVILMTWVENYGDQTASTAHSFGQALGSIKSDYKILCLGLIQSLFEGSMYTFVLEWTPALTPPEPTVVSKGATTSKEDVHRATIPHGYIFAGFMVAIMIGSSLFEIVRRKYSVESFMRPVLFISAVSLMMPILFPGNQLIIFSGFLLFEICVGLFWPSMSTMRDRFVPEATRATIMNFFRVPLNFIVIVILTQNLPMKVIFQCCVIFLVIATICQQWLYSLACKIPKAELIQQRDTEDLIPLKKDEKEELIADDEFHE